VQNDVKARCKDFLSKVSPSCPKTLRQAQLKPRGRKVWKDWNGSAVRLSAFLDFLSCMPAEGQQTELNHRTGSGRYPDRTKKPSDTESCNRFFIITFLLP
jgi:hypothetical protein